VYATHHFGSFRELEVGAKRRPKKTTTTNRALSMPRGSLILSAHRTYKKHGQSFTRNTITQINENHNKTKDNYVSKQSQ